MTKNYQKYVKLHKECTQFEKKSRINVTARNDRGRLYKTPWASSGYRPLSMTNLLVTMSMVVK